MSEYDLSKKRDRDLLKWDLVQGFKALAWFGVAIFLGLQAVGLTPVGVFGMILAAPATICICWMIFRAIFIDFD